MSGKPTIPKTIEGIIKEIEKKGDSERYPYIQEVRAHLADPDKFAETCIKSVTQAFAVIRPEASSGEQQITAKQVLKLGTELEEFGKFVGNKEGKFPLTLIAKMAKERKIKITDVALTDAKLNTAISRAKGESEPIDFFLGRTRFASVIGAGETALDGVSTLAGAASSALGSVAGAASGVLGAATDLGSRGLRSVGDTASSAFTEVASRVRGALTSSTAADKPHSLPRERLEDSLGINKEELEKILSNPRVAGALSGLSSVSFLASTISKETTVEDALGSSLASAFGERVGELRDNLPPQIKEMKLSKAIELADLASARAKELTSRDAPSVRAASSAAPQKRSPAAAATSAKASTPSPEREALAESSARIPAAGGPPSASIEASAAPSITVGLFVGKEDFFESIKETPHLRPGPDGGFREAALTVSALRGSLPSTAGQSGAASAAPAPTPAQTQLKDKGGHGVR